MKNVSHKNIHRNVFMNTFVYKVHDRTVINSSIDKLVPTFVMEGEEIITFYDVSFTFENLENDHITHENFLNNNYKQLFQELTKLKRRLL